MANVKYDYFVRAAATNKPDCGEVRVWTIS
jgi:hypothetical protein